MTKRSGGRVAAVWWKIRGVESLKVEGVASLKVGAWCRGAAVVEHVAGVCERSEIWRGVPHIGD